MSHKIPRWLSGYFEVSDQNKIHELIQRVETKTSAELVPLIVHSSIDLSLFRQFVVSLCLLLTVALTPWIGSLWGWSSWASLEITGLILGLILVTLGFFATESSLFVRLFFSKQSLQKWVHRRACYEFFANRLHSSESRTAVLFMYSLLEKKAMIIADTTLDAIPEHVWQEAVTKMISAAKQKDFCLGFKEAIEFTAEALSRHYPAQVLNKNEIADHVLFKE